ncbi:hypothetical protein Cgig2_023272 [Carnegiea gigantea]|uniref:Uncharacterized protein n=1 Tax=Carnegiea gigantea TaxID=171969 RepID=A0A9Q1JN64_9CARY|nr:hypothetical protein Cgig2_023272 [Carnegiea gigantea]
MYQKAFITWMSTCSFSSMVAQPNEAQTKVVRSMRFSSAMKVDLKQIPGKFLKWLVEIFDPYSAFLVLLDGKALDVYVTMGAPIGGREIMELSRSLMDEEYDEVHAALFNKAQAEAVISMEFASFLKFSKWLVECFDPYAASFVLPDGQKFPVTAFDVYMTLGEPFKGREVIEITMSSTDEEYDKVHAAWLKE